MLGGKKKNQTTWYLHFGYWHFHCNFKLRTCYSLLIMCCPVLLDQDPHGTPCKADQRTYKSPGTPQHGNLLHTLGKGSTGGMLRVKALGAQSMARWLWGSLNLIGLKTHKYPQENLTTIILALKRAGKNNIFKANNEVHWGTCATSHIGSQSYIHKGDSKPLQSSRNPGAG